MRERRRRCEHEGARGERGTGERDPRDGRERDSCVDLARFPSMTASFGADKRCDARYREGQRRTDGAKTIVAPTKSLIYL